ncbi:hypothetical protein WA026_017045 [Henosepilachna vigintioctopunctata]|uniref:Uncharacterized protein n=1 Tax=Henosepilachna vigintioctopunctata TaxID=420089 RepID=A0AAW1TV60_9CUCU
MSTSQKRKFSEHDLHNAYKKKMKTEEPLHKEISSPQGKNITSSKKCKSKMVSTRGQTPSVTYFFKKTKMPPQKFFKDMICVRDKKVFRSGNIEKKINDNEISKIIPGNVEDVHLSMNKTCNRQKNSQNSDFNCSILPKKKFIVSNIVEDKVVTSDEMFSYTVVENTHQSIDQFLLKSNSIETETADKKNLRQICRSSSLQKISSTELQQPKMEYSVSQVSKILHPKKKNYSHLIQDKSVLPGDKNAEKKLFALESDSSTSNNKHSKLTDEYVSHKNKHLEKTQEFHSMFYTMSQNIQKYSFPFISPIKDEINMGEYVDITNILNQYGVEKKSLLRKTKDFHSMYSTLSLNISSPLLFPTEEGRNKTVQEKPPGKYSANCYKEHTEKSLNDLESQTVLKKMSSFENFIENFSHVSKSRNSITINFSDSVLLCENDNISFNKNGIIHLSSSLPETNDETLLGDRAKLFMNIDHLGIQSRTKPLKNISKTVEELNIAETISSITNIESITEEQSLNNLNKLTTNKSLNACTNGNLISKTKIGNKNNITHRLNSDKSAKTKSISGIFRTVERNRTKFPCESTMRSNVNNQSSAHNYESVSTELSNERYKNEKLTQSQTNFKIVFDKCQAEKYSSISSDIKTSIYNTQKEEVNQKDYPIQQYQDEQVLFSPQNIKYNKFNSNFKCSIDTEIDNQNNFEQKQFSPIKNSIIYKVSNREVVNPFGDLNLNIFENSDIISPILMTENVHHIQNLLHIIRKVMSQQTCQKCMLK